MASQICNPETTTHNPTNDAKIVNTGSYKARLIASIYPSDKSVYVFKLSQVIQGISSAVRLLVYRSAKVWSLGATTSLGSAPGIFTSGWLAIFLILSFSTQSLAQGDTYRNRFFNRDYVNSVWDNYSIPESFSKYHKKRNAPKIKEAYVKWHYKFKSAYKKKTQESLDYLAKQPLGEDIKKLHDINTAYKTWLQDFEVYALCVEWQYETKQPFLAFKDFQKMKAKYGNVNCRGKVERKCSETLNNGIWYDIDQCRIFPDWRYEEATSWVSRYTTFEKNGIHITLSD